MKFKIIYLLGITMFLLIGCQKDPINANKLKRGATLDVKVDVNSIKLPEIRNGRFYFPSMEELQKYADGLAGIDNFE